MPSPPASPNSPRHWQSLPTHMAQAPLLHVPHISTTPHGPSSGPTTPDSPPRQHSRGTRLLRPPHNPSPQCPAHGSRASPPSHTLVAAPAAPHPWQAEPPLDTPATEPPAPGMTRLQSQHKVPLDSSPSSSVRLGNANMLPRSHLGPKLRRNQCKVLAPTCHPLPC